MIPVVHVIGAGLSGLSAAVQLANAGRKVFVHEAANHAGGRCRSYFDQTLNHRIDNGNHLVLSGNRAVAEYLEIIGATDSLWSPDQAEFPFIDLQSGESWVVRPDQGKVPWSLFRASGRVPGCSLAEYLRGVNLAFADAAQTVRDCLDHCGPLYRRFWEPLAVSVLNTHPDEGSAQLLWPVLRETFGRGERACRGLMAKEGLSESFVEPACVFLRDKGGTITLGARLKAIGTDGDRATVLNFSEQQIHMGDADRIVLAVPPSMARELVPDIQAPDEFRAIVNVHFRLPAAPTSRVSFIGMVGGIGHWLFVRDDIASVTVSAAEHILDLSAGELAEKLWPEVVLALGLDEQAPCAFRVIKEKRATFAQTPEQVKKRPGSKTSVTNLFVAGDWTDTGLPATIEGSLLSGKTAAKGVLESL